MEKLHPDVKEVLFSEEDIRGIVTRMGEQITADYAEKNPLIVAVLRGAVIFTADLMRAIDCPLSVDFMAVSSYGEAAKSSGVVRIVKDLDTKIEGARCADRGGHPRLRPHAVVPHGPASRAWAGLG